MILDIEPGYSSDAGLLEWLVGPLTFGVTVGCWIPDRFPAYARILHPVWLDGVGGAGDQTPWGEVAAWSGKELGPSSSFVDLSQRLRHGETEWWGGGTSSPAEGRLEAPFLDGLAETLSASTATPEDIEVLTWAGYGFDRGLLAEYELEVNTSLSASGRRYLMSRGSIVDVDDKARHDQHEGPNFWWPADRAWFVATEIDSASTYVGADHSTISVLLSHEVLEVLAVSREDRLSGSVHA